MAQADRDTRRELSALLNRHRITQRLADIDVPRNGLFPDMAGATLGGGFYRFHTLESARRSDEQCGRLIGNFRGAYNCFAFDWLGREMAVDRTGNVIVVEAGSGEYLSPECKLDEWHDIVASEDEDPLAYTTYAEFRRWNPQARDLKFSEAVGYRVPLLLGGDDDFDNLEVCNREVYVDLSIQIALATRDLPGRLTDG